VSEPFKFPRFEGDALCATTDPEAFFPEQGKSLHDAKRTCERCEVREPCLAWALANHEHGVWGGTSEQQRKEMLNQRRRARRLKPINHGTDSGAAQHRYRGEPPCQSCAAAANIAWTLRQKKDECPVCGVWMLRSSIRRHVERRHPDAQEGVA
jgi:hypothetical protein